MLKEAEDQLRRSEAYLAEAQRLSHTGTWVLDATTNQYLYWSDECYRIWGFDPLQGLPSRDTMLQRIHPDDRDRRWEEVQEALRQKKDYSGEFRIVLPNGTVKYLAATGHHQFSKNGELVEAIGTVVDVTERKRAEQALRESEYKLRQIAETVPGFLWSAAPDGDLTHVNQRILDYSGARLEDFTRRGWQTFLHPDDLPETAKAFYHAIQTGTSYQAFFRLRRADGEYRWYHTRGEPLCDRQGRIIHWYGLSIDIDEAKKAEERLRRSEAYLAESQRLSHTSSAVFNKTTVFYWSEETYRMWGFDPLQGVPSREAVRQRMHPDDWDRVEENIERGVREKRSVANEFRIILPDETVKHIEATNYPVFSASGELLEIVGTGVDVTERKRVEERLRVQHTVAQILAEAATIEEATPRMLLAMGECLGWDVGVLWRVDREAQALRCVELWHKPSIEVPEFERVSRELTFGPGLGLPGRVWSSLEPEYIADVVPDENFPRAPIAEREGLRAAFGFPILLEGEVLGVIEFFSREIRPPHQELLKVLATIGSQIGQFIERKRAEEALRASEAKIRRLVDANIIGIFIWDFDGRILEANDAFLDIVGYDHEDLVAGRIQWTDLTPPEWRDRDTRLIEEQKATGTLQPFEKEYFRKDGSRVPVLIGVATFKESGNQGVAFVLDLTERKRAEQALRRSEAHLAEAQRLSHTGAVTYNGTAILFASEETYRIWGFDPAQGLPSREAVFQRIHPGDRDWLNAEVRRAVDEKRKFSIGYRIVMPDGTVKHLETIGQPMFSASGELVEIFAIQTDVTERKRAEEGLRESEAKFRDYAETASDWFWEIGPDYKFTLLTENAFGSGASDRIGTACWDHALDLETESEKWRLLLATLDSRKPIRDFVYCGLGGNGTPMYVRASGKPMFDADGEFRGYRGTGTDVTAIMRTQEALRESERSARSALDGIAGLVAIMTPNGEVETVNRQCLEYFGRSLEDLKSWQISDTVHPEDLPQMLVNFKRAIASEIPYHFEQRLRRFDGEYRWFDTRGGAVRDNTGRIVRWYVLLTDIEDRTRALERLEQMQSNFAHMNRVSMMGELAASLSHEITQPIASARNNARAAQNFLDMQPPDLGEVREALSCVVGDTDRAGDIVDRIRDHIKKAPTRKDQFDLNAAINEVLGLAQNTITKNGVSVRTRLADGLFPVRGDRVQLQQVVLNLILNAVEAMGSIEDGARELSIRTEQDQTGVLVTVADSGPGIQPEHLERIFKSFYTTKPSGTGMGLSICRSIIDEHAGRLWVETNEPRGAIFQFTLPGVEVRS